MAPNEPLARAAEAAPFLQIQHIVKKFDDVFAVDDVSLNIAQGEIFALLGSSGCGKADCGEEIFAHKAFRQRNHRVRRV